MPALPVLAEPLSDGVIAVRDAAERDIPEVLIAYEDDPGLHLRLGQVRPPSGAQLGRAVESERADRTAGSRAALTIVEPPSDVCVGQVSVHELDWDHARAEVSIWIAPQARGRGLAGRALALVGAWLLRPGGLERVGLLCEADNEPMLRAAARAGFRAEGVLRAYLRRRGRRVDAASLSLLPGDLEGA